MYNILLQIVDGNAKTDVSNRKEPGMFCGESEQPQIFMSETSFVKVLFHVENFTDQTYFSFDTRAEQQLVVYLRYGQHPELYPNRRGEIVQGWVGFCFIERFVLLGVIRYDCFWTNLTMRCRQEVNEQFVGELYGYVLLLEVITVSSIQNLN